MSLSWFFGTNAEETEERKHSGEMSTYFNDEGELLVRCDGPQECKFIDVEFAVEAMLPVGWETTLPYIDFVQHKSGDEEIALEFHGPNGEHVGYNVPITERCYAAGLFYGLCDCGATPTNATILQAISVSLDANAVERAEKAKEEVQEMLTENAEDYIGVDFK